MNNFLVECWGFDKSNPASYSISSDLYCIVILDGGRGGGRISLRWRARGFIRRRGRGRPKSVAVAARLRKLSQTIFCTERERGSCLSLMLSVISRPTSHHTHFAERLSNSWFWLRVCVASRDKEITPVSCLPKYQFNDFDLLKETAVWMCIDSAWGKGWKPAISLELSLWGSHCGIKDDQRFIRHLWAVNTTFEQAI